jgi:hypothetical protein
VVEWEVQSQPLIPSWVISLGGVSMVLEWSPLRYLCWISPTPVSLLGATPSWVSAPGIQMGEPSWVSSVQSSPSLNTAFYVSKEGTFNTLGRASRASTRFVSQTGWLLTLLPHGLLLVRVSPCASGNRRARLSLPTDLHTLIMQTDNKTKWGKFSLYFLYSLTIT